MKYILLTSIIAALLVSGCSNPDQTPTRELTEQVNALAIQINALAIKVGELSQTNAELAIAASATDSTLEQALNTQAQASQALTAQTQVLAQEIADLGQTNSELAKSVPDPGTNTSADETDQRSGRRSRGTRPNERSIGKVSSRFRTITDADETDQRSGRRSRESQPDER